MWVTEVYIEATVLFPQLSSRNVKFPKHVPRRRGCRMCITGTRKPVGIAGCLASPASCTVRIDPRRCSKESESFFSPETSSCAHITYVRISYARSPVRYRESDGYWSGGQNKINNGWTGLQSRRLNEWIRWLRDSHIVIRFCRLGP